MKPAVNNEDVWNDNAPFRMKELKGHIDKTYWDLLVPFFKKKVDDIVNHDRIIDIGCGLGFLTNELSSHTKEIIGIDTSDVCINLAKNNFLDVKEYINISIIEYSEKYRNTFYDVCISNMVFHTLEHLDKNIKAIYNFLKNGGNLLFTIPHPCFWYSSRPYFDNKSYRYEKETSFTVPFKIHGGKNHPSKIMYWHRSIEFYSKVLKDNGFTTIEQIEPRLENTGPKDILYWACQKHL